MTNYLKTVRDALGDANYTYLGGDYTVCMKPSQFDMICATLDRIIAEKQQTPATLDECFEAAELLQDVAVKSKSGGDNQEDLELIEAIPTKQLVEMLKDPPEDVDWTGDLGLFKRAAWRIEELDGIFSPRFIVPRARYNGRVHEAVNEAVSAFIKHQHTIRYNDRWLKPEEYQLSIGACGEMIQAYLDFFTAVQDGEENPAPENTIDAIIRAEQKGGV